jgi:amino acid transporter
MNDLGIKLWLWLTQAGTIPTIKDKIPDATSGNWLGNLLNLVYFMAGIACTVMIVISGIHWTISSGQPEKVKKAQQTLTYAIVGLIIIIAAFAITRFVIAGVK